MKRKVLISKRIEKIVSLVPSQTELLCDLGLQEKLVGITRFCVHPNRLRQTKTIIGGTKSFDFEKIKMLKPDLVIGNKEENYKEGIDELTKHYPVWMSDIYTLPDALVMIDSIGKITGTPQRAKSLVMQIKDDFNGLPIKKNKATVAYLIWRKPFMVAGRNTFINDILNRIGFVNLFPETTTRYPEVDLQHLIKKQPDYIFLSSEPYPFKKRHINEFKKHLPNSKILLVDGEMFSWYGSRLIKAVPYFKTLF